METEAQEIIAEEKAFLMALINENASRKATGYAQPSQF
jgi:hypothetical protein